MVMNPLAPFYNKTGMESTRLSLDESRSLLDRDLFVDVEDIFRKKIESASDRQEFVFSNWLVWA